MRIPRVFLEGAKSGRVLEVGGGQYRHLVLVLRRSSGDPLVVFDGQGGVFRAVMGQVDPDREIMQVQVGDHMPQAPLRVSPLTLAMGIPRGDGFEMALRWGSEMGLLRLIPLFTERCVVRLPSSRKGRKMERWRKIAREAAEQCQRAVPLIVEEPVRLEDLLDRVKGYPSRWIAVPGGGDLAASGLAEALGKGIEGGVLVLVGPEGGFSPEEITRAVDSGFRPVGFPTPVLKTPTAVAYLAALAGLAGQVNQGSQIDLVDLDR